MRRVGVLIWLGLIGAMLTLRLTVTASRISAGDPVRPLTAMDCPPSYATTGPMGGTVTCGRMAVPERRDKSDSATIYVAYAVFRPTTRTGMAPDPLIYLDGGPGAATLATGNVLYQKVIQPITKSRRDVILFDQRGAGLSTPSLICNLTASDAVTADQRMAAWHDRLQRDVTDLDGLTSSAVADDVYDLMRALGYQQYNLLGVSNGTRVAQLLLRQHPQRVRSVVMDGTIPLDANWLAEIPSNYQGAIRAVAKACQQQSACARAPSFESDLFAAERRFDSAPHNLQAIDSHGVAQTVKVDGAMFLGLVDFMLRSGGSWTAYLPLITSQAAAGDFALFDRLAAPIATAITGISVSSVDYDAFICHEEEPFESPAVVAKAQTGVDPALLKLATTLDRCSAWPASAPDPLWHRAIVSEVPALVLAGEFDPIAPPRYGQQVASRMRNATFLQFPGLGHGMLGNLCAQLIVSQFLDSPGPAAKHGCHDALGEPLFPVRSP